MLKQMLSIPERLTNRGADAFGYWLATGLLLPEHPD